jgi:AraC family transcriptional regulator
LESFAGRVVQRRDVSGIIVQELSYSPGASRGRHKHTAPFISFVLEGHFLEHCDGRAVDHKANTLVLHPAGETHSHRFGASGGRILAVEITPEGLERLRSRGINLLPRIERMAGPVVQLAQRLFQQMQFNDQLTTLSLEGIILETLAQLLRSSEPAHPHFRWMKRVIEYLQSNFASDVELAQIADIAGIHPVHLARSFRSAHGCTLGEYVRRLRIEDACKRLANTDLLITELALECGFFDHSHFCRTFKDRIGVSPSEFRRAKRGTT